MKIFQILILLLISFIDLSFSACGSISDQPTLALKTSTASWAGSNANIHVNILTNNGWIGWREIDNAWCDDFEAGNTDYFNEFNDITLEWDAVAIYNCGTDGWNMDEMGYWDGEDLVWMDEFCKNIGGAGKECGEDEIINRHCGDETVPKVDRYWIDQDDEHCPLVVIETTPFPGKYLRRSDPGSPSC